MPVPILAVMAAKRLAAGQAKKMAVNAAGSATGGGGLKAAAGNFLKTPTADGMTRGQKGFNWLLYGGMGILFIVILGAVYWLTFLKNKKSTRKLAQPSPMNNARVSRPAHEERMFTNKPDRRNKYRKQLSTGGDEYGGYYGSNSRGFSQSEESYLHPMNNNSNVQKPQFYLKNPGNNNPSILSEINLSDDPAYEEELYDEMKSNLMAKDNRRKARLSKSIKNGKYNTGHIDQVSEINVASSLSASNNFQGPFGTNNGDRVVQRYIQPIEKRGVTSDALNFASITK